MSNTSADRGAGAAPVATRLRLAASEAPGLPAHLLAALQVRVAEYPDCQQLQLWLPRAVRAEDWRCLQLRDGAGQRLLDAPVDTLLQDRTRLLLDALDWPVGALRLEISHRSGGCLRLLLHKEAQAVVLPQPAVQADDGEDLRWRAALARQLGARLTRRLSYASQGRSGTVFFHEGTLRLAFPYEMSGDAAEPLSISVPVEAEWEGATGVTLKRRSEILAFVAETARHEQSRNWQVEVRADVIVFLAAPAGPEPPGA